MKRSEDDGFIANVEWNVRESLSHFGHTHYRRNQYHALAACVMDGDFWKIKDIDLMEEQRRFNGGWVDYLPEVTLRR